MVVAPPALPSSFSDLGKGEGGRRERKGHKHNSISPPQLQREREREFSKSRTDALSHILPLLLHSRNGCRLHISAHTHIFICRKRRRDGQYSGPPLYVGYFPVVSTYSSHHQVSNILCNPLYTRSYGISKLLAADFDLAALYNDMRIPLYYC